MGKITATSFGEMIDEIREMHKAGFKTRWSCKKRDDGYWVATGFIRQPLSAAS